LRYLLLIALLAPLLAPAQDTLVRGRADTVLRGRSDTVLRGRNDTVLRGRADSLREIRIIGHKPPVEKKLDRTIVHVDALLANTGGQAWDVLGNTPGVTTEEDGSISLNGNAGVMILIDDRPTYLSGEQLMNFLKSLPASQLDQVELLPNPPARYPAAGAAGIIIIRTKRAAKDGFQAQLSTNYSQGIYPKTNTSLGLLGQHGPWKFNAVFAYYYSSNWNNSRRYRDYVPPYGSVNQNYTEVNFDHAFNESIDLEHKKNWGFLFNLLNNPYHERGNYLDSFFDAGSKYDSLEDVMSHFNRHTTTLSANAHVTGKHLSADADFVHYQDRSFQWETDTTFSLQTTQSFHANIYSVKGDYTNAFLDAGVQSSISVRQDTGSYVPLDSLNNSFHYTEQINAAYVSAHRTFGRFEVQAGLRLENTNGSGKSEGSLDSSFSLNYTNLFPSAHALWTSDSMRRHQVGFAYARRIDRPGYNDLNPMRFFWDPQTYMGGNPALQPEFSNHFELSYTYLNRYTLTASYIRTLGSIDQVFIAQPPEFFYYDINMDRYDNWGLNGDASVGVGHWSLNAHAEFRYERYVSALPDSAILDKTLPYFTISGSTKYVFAGGWSAEVSGWYRTDHLFAQSVMRPTGRLNLALRKKLFGSRGTLTLAGYDVLRTNIVARYIYLPNALVHFSNAFDRRQVAVTFAYTFGKTAIKIAEHTTGVESERSRL